MNTLNAGVQEHRHCIFCQTVIPIPLPANLDVTCKAVSNWTTPDTTGKKRHVWIAPITDASKGGFGTKYDYLTSTGV